MNVGKLIETVTVLIGQQYDLEMMIGWLNEIEGQVLDQVVNRAQGYDIEFKPFTEEDMERELAVPDRFQDVYINCIRAKVDIANQETERYNNDAAMFDAAWKEYAAWHIRNNLPKPARKFRNY